MGLCCSWVPGDGMRYWCGSEGFAGLVMVRALLVGCPSGGSPHPTLTLPTRQQKAPNTYGLGLQV